MSNFADDYIIILYLILNGYIINHYHGDDDCLCKQCGVNGLVNKLNSDLWFYSI